MAVLNMLQKFCGLSFCFLDVTFFLTKISKVLHMSICVLSMNCIFSLFFSLNTSNGESSHVLEECDPVKERNLFCAAVKEIKIEA